MGMGWVPLRKLPVVAVGDAVILGADSHAGWPGHHIIWYQLLDGSHAGEVIYVSEHLTKLARTGSFVAAGQKIAVAFDPDGMVILIGAEDPLALSAQRPDASRSLIA